VSDYNTCGVNYGPFCEYKSFNEPTRCVFLVLDWNRPVLEGLDTGQKILKGYFTSISTRTAGFNTIDEHSLTRTVNHSSVPPMVPSPPMMEHNVASYTFETKSVSAPVSLNTCQSMVHRRC
jgi:hypothetical protein